MARTQYRYVGGPAINYLDAIDTNRLWSPVLEHTLQELERLVEVVLATETSGRRQQDAANRVRGYVREVRMHVERGDAEAAAQSAIGLGLWADGLALAHEFGRDLAAGQNLRTGGVKGSEHAGHDRERHARWMELNEELKPTVPSERARAREIATRTKAEVGTVRTFIRRHR